MQPKDPLGPPELPRGVKAVVPSSPTPTQAPEEPLIDEHDELDDLNEHVELPGDPDGLVAAEEQRKWQAQHPKPSFAAAPPAKRKRRWPIVLLVVLLIAAAAAGAYWFGNKQADKTSSGSSTQQTNKTAGQKAASPATTAVPTKHYDSTTYTLGIDYPQTWALSDTSAKLTLISPAMQLVTASGATSGHAVVTFQNQQTTIAGYPSGGALAALESYKLTYKQPTSVQRAQSYVSYLGYAQTTGLNALYVTGDNGYQQGQQVPMSDIIKGNPLISVTFQTCASSDCSTGTPTPITLLAAKWNDSAISKTILTLLASVTLD
jgi:hypothetical protein